MEVFIGNLPGTATLLELSSFLSGIVIRPDFQCYEGRDRSQQDYHYFVARVGTREEGEALITRLNGHAFAGQRIEAREFVRRAPCSEWRGAERRVNPY